MVANTPEAEHDVTVELVRALLEDQHPDLAGLALREVASGWDNVVFRLGDDLAVRVPRRLAAAALVEHEQRWLPALAPHLPLPVPAPVRVGRPALGYPWCWSVVPWFAGADAATSPPVDPHDAAVTVGSFLAALHRPSPPDAPVSPVRGVPLADRHDLTARFLDRIRGAPGIDGWEGPEGIIDVAAARARWDELAATPGWDRPPVWVHGDLHPANLVVAGGRITAVVDFGDLTAGDPATDLLVAWPLLPAAERPTLRAAAGDIDDDTWRRARGWALTHAAACLANSADDPRIAGFSRRSLAAVLADPEP